MAAVSAPHAPSALTPPSSSHGGPGSWTYSASPQTEAASNAKITEFSGRPPATQPNGNHVGQQSSRPDLSQKRTDTTRSNDSGYLAPARVNALNRKDSSISEAGSAPDSLLDLYGQRDVHSMDHGERKKEVYADEEEDPEHSRWIHRDKLARIESQELQAAGIILPRSRAASKSSRRDRSREHPSNGLRSEQAQKRQRVESIPTEEEEEQDTRDWDLRLPGEAAEAAEYPGEGFQDISGGVKGVSRIPVYTTSPIPIPIEHLERDTPIRRMQSEVWTAEDELSNPKTRGRSTSVKVLEDAPTTPTPATRTVSETSPKKTVRKGSTPTTRNPSAQRTKARANSNRDAPPTQRPVTRSGDSSGSASSKRPEGDPPWLTSMYKPDPRLPPDQQLLPTVARRLQQEQWKKEGKFASTYDTQFEPMNDELPAPEPAPEPIPEPMAGPPEHAREKLLSSPEPKLLERDSEWPLRGSKSPTLSRPGTAGGYSTMPKINVTRQEAVPSPMLPMMMDEPVEEKKKGGGCGCCAVM